MRKSVVLPDPFGPTRPTFSPGLSWNDASTNRSCLPYCLLMRVSEIMRRLIPNRGSCDHSIAMTSVRAYRAGESLEDLCRACKADRMHTVVVVDADGRPIRVACGYCRSEHNYRGGPKVAPSGAPRSPDPVSGARRPPPD